MWNSSGLAKVKTCMHCGWLVESEEMCVVVICHVKLWKSWKVSGISYESLRCSSM
jgi:hypothetical protein